MAANPCVVAVETWIHWDGVAQRLPRGQVMDVVPGSALERAIGAERLVPLGGAVRTSVEPVEPVKPVEATGRGGGGGASNSSEAGGGATSSVSPPKSRTVGRKQGDSEDGGE